MQAKSIQCLAAVVAVCLCAPVAPAQTTWYVDDDNCPGPGTGTSEDPFCTISQGIAAAIDGDTVLVMDGMYTGVGNRDLSFGGRLITVRAANGPDNCTIDCEGHAAEPHRAFLFITNEDQNAVLDGFTICNAFYEGMGGAILCEFASPTIRNCLFVDNYVTGTGSWWTGWGGAIHTEDGGPLIEDCTFINNEAHSIGTRHTGTGGAISCVRGTPAVTIKRCDFFGNRATRDGTLGGNGGAISVRLTRPIVIEDCLFVQNTSDHFGGAITSATENDTHVARCAFVDNHAPDQGGAIYFSYTRTKVADTVFLGNTSAKGAAIISFAPHADSDSWIVNMLCAGNVAVDGAACVGHGAGAPERLLTIINSTFADNWGTLGAIGTGDAFGETHLDIDNAIVWGNAVTQMTNAPGAVMTVTHSDVEGGWPGTANLDSNPMFPPAGSGEWTEDGVYTATAWQTTFVDANAAWAANELAGMALLPDAEPDDSGEYRQSLIVANTATTITVWGDFASLGSAAASYEIKEYPISPGSPCIDTGNTAALPLDELDLDGDADTTEALPLDLANNPRVAWCVVDMGAYEYQGPFGDADDNCTVDLLDYTTFAECIEGPNVTATDECREVFDFYADEDVDLADFTVMQLMFLP